KGLLVELCERIERLSRSPAGARSGGTSRWCWRRSGGRLRCRLHTRRRHLVHQAHLQPDVPYTSFQVRIWVELDIRLRHPLKIGPVLLVLEHGELLEELLLGLRRNIVPLDHHVHQRREVLHQHPGNTLHRVHVELSLQPRQYLPRISISEFLEHFISQSRFVILRGQNIHDRRALLFRSLDDRVRVCNRRGGLSLKLFLALPRRDFFSGLLLFRGLFTVFLLFLSGRLFFLARFAGRRLVDRRLFTLCAFARGSCFVSRGRGRFGRWAFAVVVVAQVKALKLRPDTILI